MATIPTVINFSVTPEDLTTIESLIRTLQELTARLAVLASWASSGAPGMRVVNVGTVTVTGPQTSAQFIAANLTQKIAIENMNAVLSNINNVVGV